MKKILIYIITIIVLISCKNLRKDVDLNLPKFEEQIQIECYLENYRQECQYRGIPLPIPQIQAAISKSQSYNGTVDTPFQAGARVLVSWNGGQIELQNNNIPNTCDTSNYKLFNYKNYLTPFTLTPGVKYTMDVTTKDGKHITAESVCPPLPVLDSITLTYDATAKSMLIFATIADDGATTDYYRASMYNISRKGNHRLRDGVFTDINYNGGKIPFGVITSKFENGDTCIFSLYHINKEYYRFYRTVSIAQNAAGNPFASPAFIESNVNGGVGIFTCTPSIRKVLILKK